MTPDRGWQPRVREPSAGAARPICEDRSSAGAVTTTRNPTDARSPVRTDPDRRHPLRAPTGRTGRASFWRATAAGFALVLTVLLGDGVVRPAAAEAPAGDMESIVTSIEPATPGAEVRVLGGDESLRLDVHDGHEVVVLGYVGEPYLRIDPRGEVWENQRSPAVPPTRIAPTPGRRRRPPIPRRNRSGSTSAPAPPTSGTTTACTG